MPDLVPPDRCSKQLSSLLGADGRPRRRVIRSAERRSRSDPWRPISTRRVTAGVLAVVAATALQLQAQIQNPILTFDAAFTVALRRNAGLEGLRRQQAIWDVLHARETPMPHVDARVDHDCAPRCTTVASSIDTCVPGPMQQAPAPTGGAFTDRDVVLIAHILRRNLREAFYDLLLRDAEVGETQNLIDFASEFRTVDTSDAEATHRARLDTLRVEIALAQASVELIRAESRRRSAQAAFNAVLNRAPDAPVTIGGELTDPIPLPQLDPAIRLSRAMDVELRQLRHELDIQRRARAMSGRPGRGRPHSSGAARRTTAGANNARPLDPEDAVVAEQIAQLDAARAARERLLEDCMRDQFGRVEGERRMVRHFEDALIPAATASVTGTVAAYRAGRAGVMEVIESQRALADLRRGYLRSLHDLRVSEADVEARLPAMGLKA